MREISALLRRVSRKGSIFVGEMVVTSPWRMQALEAKKIGAGPAESALGRPLRASVGFRGIIRIHKKEVLASALEKTLGRFPCLSASGKNSHQRSIIPAAVTSDVSSYPFPERNARLVLEDGSVWPGCAFGATGTALGEVVFNTSLSGYQEIMTDPSYYGQLVVFTCPHIGNVGTNAEDMESEKAYTGGVIVRQKSPLVSNWRAEISLDEFLAEQNVVGISDVDTRAITRRIRTTGCLNGIICTDPSIPEEELLARVKAWSIEGKDLISDVSSKETYQWSESTSSFWEFHDSLGAESFNVVVFDFGVKRNILKRLASHGCKLTVVPANTSAEEVLAHNPDGIFLSNGPGDPSAVPNIVETVRSLIGKLPIFGICMGHQILGQALGGKTFKLTFGHHGGNHPVKNDLTKKIEISAQNHNYAVDISSLGEGIEVSHLNLNDGTCSGLIVPSKQIIGIQYHPESSPGPHDGDGGFSYFVDMMKESRVTVP